MDGNWSNFGPFIICIIVFLFSSSFSSDLDYLYIYIYILTFIEGLGFHILFKYHILIYKINYFIK